MSAYGQLLGINFNELKVLMGKSGKFDLSILYGRLKYQVNRTKLTPKGKREIARTREMVAAYNGKGLTATDEDLAALVGMGAIDCRAGMWMGNKLHSLAVEYLNQSCGLSWAGYKALYSQLYEFLRPSAPGLEEPIDEQAANPNRAASSPRGPGIIQVRSQDDKAMYIGPDTSSFAHGLAVLDRLKGDMHSVTYQMALGADTKGAVIKRAADSKEKDGEASVVVLVAVGEELRDHGATVATAVARVRSPKPGAEAGAGTAEEWKVGGMEKFEVADLTEQINQVVMVEGISIPSATYQRKRKARLARADLGAEATTEVMSDVEDELEQAITQDQFTTAPMALPGPAADPAADPPDDPTDPADAGEVEDPPAEPPPPAKKKPVGKR